MTNPTRLGCGDFVRNLGAIRPSAVPATAASVTRLAARRMFDWRRVNPILSTLSLAE